MNERIQKNRIYLFIVFSVTTDQFNSSLLNRSINFLNKNIYNSSIYHVLFLDMYHDDIYYNLYNSSATVLLIKYLFI